MLWQRLKAWLSNQLWPINAPKYRIIDRGETIQSSFLIEEGDFKGTEFLIGKVKLPTDTCPTLSFTTQILKDPSGKAELDVDDSFTNAAGCILQLHLRHEQGDFRNWLYRKS